jgi:hypothetical protein
MSRFDDAESLVDTLAVWILTLIALISRDARWWTSIGSTVTASTKCAQVPASVFTLISRQLHLRCHSIDLKY